MRTRPQQLQDELKKEHKVKIEPVFEGSMLLSKVEKLSGISE